MTVETKTTIELSDVLTVEFKCAHCLSISSWPLAIAKQPPTRCHCGHENWMTHGGDVFTALCDLLHLMKRFSTVNANEPYVLRFGIKSQKFSDHASDEKD